MRLVCPKCSSQYEVDISLFPDEGREVQCSNCEEIWFQYPVEDEKPLRLDDPAVVPPATESRPSRPSQRLADDEQRELAAAVQQEIAARDSGPDRPRRKIERREETPADDEILAALREQIEKEGGDFEDDAPAKSQKRNLAKAAENAGISVDRQQSAAGRNWNVADGHADDESGERRGWSRRGRETAPQNPRRGRKDGLAAALRDLEETDRRGGHGFRNGFLTAVVLAGLGSAVYLFQEDIAQAYPPAEPWLAQYDRIIDEGRDHAETLYAEYMPVVEGAVDRAVAMVVDLTAQDEATSGGSPAE